jgi:hypothetical protein
MITLNRFKSFTFKSHSFSISLREFNFQFKNRLHNKKNASVYEDNYKESIENPESYWKSKENLVEWYEKPKLILDQKNILKNHWY